MNDKIRHLRQDYKHATLDEGEIEISPLIQFHKWFEEAMAAELPEPHAMTLSTVNPECKPSSRIVLLRNADEKGFVFFSNYLSRKGKEAERNPYAALNFFWQAIERQVRVEGKIQRLNEKDSDDYFASRPRESQIGAWASMQSETISSRKELEEKVKDFQQQFEGKPVPRPPHWGGFCLIPDYFEFWQGRTSRLHDRIYFKLQNGQWQHGRLNP